MMCGSYLRMRFLAFRALSVDYSYSACDIRSWQMFALIEDLLLNMNIFAVDLLRNSKISSNVTVISANYYYPTTFTFLCSIFKYFIVFFFVLLKIHTYA